ncbi:MAG TPA: hypothetical protein VGI39_39385 [Polyangiaceae bacterium]
MALGSANRPKPGLKAIYDGREARKPGGKYGRPTTGLYIFGVSAILASLVVYHFVSDYQLDSEKRDLLAGQRAMKATIGQEWFPLRDELEQFTLDAAKSFKGDFVDSEAARWDFRSLPGVYLRLRVADAKDVGTLRQAAGGSVKDAFTGCFLREPNKAAALGVPDAGAFSEQPWNLGKAYAATWVMGDDWADGVKAADGEMRVRLFKEQYEKATKFDVKTAAEVVKQAKFFLLVLDEDAPEAAAVADGGVIDEAALQLVPHWSRVHVLDLRTKAELFRLRRQGNARFVFAGEHATTDPETRDAMQRQVNNCSLADQVRAEIVVKGDAGAR